MGTMGQLERTQPFIHSAWYWEELCHHQIENRHSFADWMLKILPKIAIIIKNQKRKDRPYPSGLQIIRKQVKPLNLSQQIFNLANWLWNKLKKKLPHTIFNENRIKDITNKLDEKTVRSYILTPLTKREREVLVYLAHGTSYQEIANGMSISKKTVEKHVTNIYKKLDVNNRTQAAKIAIKAGLLDS